MKEIIVLGQKSYPNDIETEKIKVIGHAKFTKNIQTKILDNRGATKVLGEAKMKELMNIGQFISGRLDVELVHSKGHLSIKGDVTSAKQFYSNGMLSVTGDITCPVITIKRGILGRIGSSCCKNLFGEKIEIECMKVNKIDGDVVIIGPKSIVEELVYGSEYKIHQTSTVHKISKRGEINEQSCKPGCYV